MRDPPPIAKDFMKIKNRGPDDVLAKNPWNFTETREIHPIVDIAIGEGDDCPAGFDRPLFATKFPHLLEMAVTSKLDRHF